MKKYLILYLVILLIILSNSCITLKKCQDRYHWTSHSDTFIVYRDTIIKVPVMGTDTVYKYGTLTDTIHINVGNAHNVVYVRHDTIESFLWLSDTTYKVKLDSAIKVIHTMQTNQVIVVQKPKLTKVLNQLIVLAVLLLIGFIIPRILKKKS